MNIVFSRHAEDMLTEPELMRDWMKRAVSDPDWTEPDSHPGRIRSFRAIPERDMKMLRVVHVRDEETCRIVTAFFDRKRRR
ncbi:MAG TPA: DUF4258 domain-containing protein [Lichenihabitans sp.]|jgi:hypothetical protein|nr:DUF4258 domain-containing protein [Lichenihabitans sp.]